MKYRAPMDDKEIDRFNKRVQIFMARGWRQEEAEQWADSLCLRDREGDDRRICNECSELQEDGKCFPAKQGWMKGVSWRFEPVRDILHRCGWFRWAKPKAGSSAR